MRPSAGGRQAAAAIADHAVIGDCRSAALVSTHGEIAWLCWPHFHSPAIFASILDAGRGGRFAIAPPGAAEVERRYRDGSNVLETTFEQDGASARLIDAMPLPCGDPSVRPLREILRCVEGVSGSLRLDVRLEPRPDFGRARVRLRQRGRGLWAWDWPGHLLMLQTDAALVPDGEALAGEVHVAPGERRWLSLTHAHGDAGVIAGLGAAAEQRLEDTTAWWRRWSAQACYDGPHREEVVRSALVLKLLACAQTGAVVAAPSSSLPEWPGADRNWDYRYCWLRDAALTMRAFTGLGYLQEARAFLDWLLHATRLTWPRLDVVYDIHGRNDLPERILEGWQGYRGSRPVRIGNDAREQLQLDVYGAVCHAARSLVDATGELQRDEARLLRGFAREVCRAWSAPDNGIWEIRGARRRYTFSAIMCWIALDSLLALAQAGHLRLDAQVRAAAGAIREEIEARGFNPALGSYAGTFGGAEADASLLLGGCLGYRDPADQRMRGTFDYVERKLGRNGLLLRYEPGYDGNATPEGAFGLCSFLAVDHLARRGERDRAQRSFGHVLGFANDVGLLSEEIDPDSGELLGNFPQTYTHVGLINAALGLAS